MVLIIFYYEFQPAPIYCLRHRCAAQQLHRGGQEPPNEVEVVKSAGAEGGMDVAPRHGNDPVEHCSGALRSPEYKSVHGSLITISWRGGRVPLPAPVVGLPQDVAFFGRLDKCGRILRQKEALPHELLRRLPDGSYIPFVALVALFDRLSRVAVCHALILGRSEWNVGPAQTAKIASLEISCSQVPAC